MSQIAEFLVKPAYRICMNLYKTATLILCLHFFVNSIEASHMMGGDITYKWLGGKKYEITFKVYRDCRGIPFNSPDIAMFGLINGSVSNSTSINYTRTSIRDISIMCNDTMDKPCSPANSPSSAGIEEHTFVSTVDFASSPFKTFVDNGYCEIYIKLEQCCRNGAITTMSPGNFYIESMMNICNSNFANSSPTFLDIGTLYAACNRPLRVNFGAYDFEDNDSIAYELSRPLNAHASYESYTGNHNQNIPMTPYCPPNPGVLSCKPLPGAKPPRGFYFDNKNADMVFTPTKCDEVGVICLKVTEYRKINGNWKMLGFTIRDIQINIRIESDENVYPELSVDDNFTFKTREKTCFDIETWDSINSYTKSNNRGDITRINMLNMPFGASFSYLDSGAGNKTGRFCWQVHDSVYHQLNNISKKIPLTIEVIDNFCPMPKFIRKTVFLKVLPPDSAGYVSSNIYYDINRNLQKDNNEKGIKHKLLVKDKNSTYSISTDTAGNYSSLFGRGQYLIGVASHPYLDELKSDTSITVKMDSIYSLDFPVYKKPGVYGYVYRDLNDNCKFDKNDLPLKGYLLMDNNNQNVGISDENGMYFIPLQSYGNYRFRCVHKIRELKVTCPDSNFIDVSYTKDSVYDGNDFAVSYNPNYSDVAVALSFNRFRRGQSSIFYIHCSNKASSVERNVKIHIPVPANMSIKSGNTTLGDAGDTVIINLDSILPFSTNTITLSTYVDANEFKALDTVWFEAFTDSVCLYKDSVKSNNRKRSLVIIDAPYDPNEKQISGLVNKTMLDNYIDYTVHFQNTGSDTAFRVVVSDTIDTRFLDLGGFEMNWSEAPCLTYMNGNVLYFIFESIKLPHLSVSGDKSISGFSFRLGLKSKIMSEDSFKNRASIYFDFEDAVVTKDAVARIVSPTQIVSVSKSGLCQEEPVDLYFNSLFEPESNNKFYLEMSDANGSFDNATLLREKSSVLKNDSFSFKAPSYLNGNFKLRIRSSSPSSFGIGGSGLSPFNVMSKPDFLINTNINNFSLCQNDTLLLDIVSQKYNFKVLKNEQEISDFSNIKSYKFKLDLNDKFSVIAIDSNNLCTDSSRIQLNILEAPKTELKILNQKVSYCSGDTLQLNANGALNYMFYGNGQIVRAYGSSETYQPVLYNSSDFLVYGYNSNGCRSSSEVMSVVVNPLPAKPVILQTNNNLSINRYSSISWYRNGDLLSDTGITLFNAPSGTYSCKVADNNFCTNKSDEFIHFNTGLNISNKSDFSIYPNPAGSVLHIRNHKTESFKAELYDHTGKLVLLIESDSQHKSSDISTLESGIYNIRLLSADGSVYMVLLSIIN